MMWTVSWAQFYQYQDANGVTIYTDDLSKVPRDQRADVRIYESVDSGPAVQIDQTQSVKDDTPAGSVGSSGDDEVEKTRIWFVHMEAKLNQERDELIRLKQAVRTPADQKNYNEKVRALNRKIQAYKQKLARFNQSLK
jgi:hypothetical protein